MLTTDLVRPRSKQEFLYAPYIDPANSHVLALATDIIALFDLHVGQTWGELREDIRLLQGTGSQALIIRGLAKLMEDRCTIAMDSPLDPREVRRRIFSAAALHHPIAAEKLPRRTSRAEILEQVAEALESTPEMLEATLYGDLPDARKVQEVPPTTPEFLLHRYNVALAQALLLRASHMTVTVREQNPARYRQLFRFIKFFRLMHQISLNPDGSWQILLDGPLSLFKLNQKYGLQFAEFLPALLLCSTYELEAEVLWSHRSAAQTFRVVPKDRLRSHYQDSGVYQSREEKWLIERFATLETPWKLEPSSELLPLGGQGILIPDFVLRHPDGREVYLEIIGFWRRNYLERRIELYREFGPKRLILAVSRQLQSSLEGLEGFEGQVYVWREVLVPRDLVNLAEKVGGGAS